MSTGPRDPAEYANELKAFRHVLDSVDVVGWPRRSVELVTLEQLIKRYPNEARGFLAKSDPPRPEPEQG